MAYPPVFPGSNAISSILLTDVRPFHSFKHGSQFIVQSFTRSDVGKRFVELNLQAGNRYVRVDLLVADTVEQVVYLLLVRLG